MYTYVYVHICLYMYTKSGVLVAIIQQWSRLCTAVIILALDLVSYLLCFHPHVVPLDFIPRSVSGGYCDCGEMPRLLQDCCPPALWKIN